MAKVSVMQSKEELLAFKVKQAIGSMAMEGMKVTRSMELSMMQVVAGTVSADNLKRDLIAKHTRKGVTD